jgi:hypothetical protein
MTISSIFPSPVGTDVVTAGPAGGSVDTAAVVEEEGCCDLVADMERSNRRLRASNRFRMMDDFVLNLIH